MMKDNGANVVLIAVSTVMIVVGLMYAIPMWNVWRLNKNKEVTQKKTEQKQLDDNHVTSRNDYIPPKVIANPAVLTGDCTTGLPSPLCEYNTVTGIFSLITDGKGNTVSGNYSTMVKCNNCTCKGNHSVMVGVSDITLDEDYTLVCPAGSFPLPKPESHTVLHRISDGN